MNLWPHQEQAIRDVLAAIAAGVARITLTSPTGGGKSVVMRRLAEHVLERGQGVVVYTNRRLLVDQLSATFGKAGLSHGVRAAGYADDRDAPLQISSIQTEASRVLKRGSWEVHDAALVLVDEAHLHTNPTALALLKRHTDAGAAVVLVTATPIDMAEMGAERLIQAGTTSELRACGALVPAKHYGPDEPDMRAWKKLVKGMQDGKDLSGSQAKKVMMVPGFFGRVWEWFERLNPTRRPTILFAPGVEESIWFAEQFAAKGVSAAHIDGEDIWVDGGFVRSDRDARQEVLDGSRTGRITVLCNRFVLREGIDCPWLAHGIFATVFGSLQSYLQSGGRLLRSHPSLDAVTVQDHGGNWWRHGSLNADREWHLDDTAASVYGVRAARIRSRKCRRCKSTNLRGPVCMACNFVGDAEGVRCPNCAMILVCGHCKGCGYDARGQKKSRPVVGTDGILKELSGDVFRPQRVSRDPDGPAKWAQMYFRSKSYKKGRTFRAAEVLFAQENGWSYPSHDWPFMPTDDLDWFRLVRDVPTHKLTTAQEAVHA